MDVDLHPSNIEILEMPGNEGRGVCAQPAVSVDDAEDHVVRVECRVGGLGQDLSADEVEGCVEGGGLARARVRRYPRQHLQVRPADTVQNLPGVVVGTVVDHHDHLV